MVWPGTYQELAMPYFPSSFRRRGAPTRGPNSPREIHVAVVWPRAMKPEMPSKSNVRQTICLLIYSHTPPCSPASGIFEHDAGIEQLPAYAVGLGEIFRLTRRGPLGDKLLDALVGIATGLARLDARGVRRSAPADL